MKRFYLYLLLGGVALAITLLARRFPGALEDERGLAHVVYLMAVLALVGPGVVYAYRGHALRATKNVALWAGIFALAFAGMAYREDGLRLIRHLQGQLIPSAPMSGQKGEVELQRAGDGHFYADAYVNGQRVRFLVDTGASRVSLSYEDAARLGIDVRNLDFTQAAATANGVAMNAAARIDYIQIGDLRLDDVKASVSQPGRMSGSLLGMSFLERLGGYRIEGEKLRMWTSVE